MNDQEQQHPPARAGPDGEEGPAASRRNVRYGLVLFAVYLVPYAGFMGLNAFFPEASGWAPFGGVNLAILYGMGLILAAVVLASIYVFLCRGPASRPDCGAEPEGR
jgi:uncharacterized membrane protein (DUF485 family)